MVRPNTVLDDHPDIVELRARYERLSETSTAQSIDGLTLLAGVYLAISPWVAGFRPVEHNLAVNNLVCGITVALLGVGYATMYGRTHGLSWVPVVLGTWTVLAPWLTRGVTVAAGTATNNVVTGIVVTILGFMTVGLASRRMAPALAADRHPAHTRRP
jgi:hypothetical protein